jgi:molecular chaperone GrpE
MLTSCRKSAFGNIFVNFLEKSNFMAEEKEKYEDGKSGREETKTGNGEGAEGRTDQQQEEPAAETSQEPTLEEKYADLNDRFIRLYSEFDNYRKRTNKERLELISSAASGILKDLIPVLDDFERAIINNENSNDVTALKEGFHLIYTKFKTVLEGKGLKMMNAKGEAFDSELHEAIANVPAPEDHLKGKVIEDVEKGYFLNEKVIRYAKVVVGQ